MTAISVRRPQRHPRAHGVADQHRALRAGGAHALGDEHRDSLGDGFDAQARLFNFALASSASAANLSAAHVASAANTV